MPASRFQQFFRILTVTLLVTAALATPAQSSATHESENSFCAICLWGDVCPTELSSYDVQCQQQCALPYAGACELSNNYPPEGPCWGSTAYIVCYADQ